MKKGVKIVTIGGGSSYTPELVEGFIKRYHELPIRELWLVDIEAGREKLEIVGVGVPVTHQNLLKDLLNAIMNFQSENFG
ncbi:family 4 glycosyl hydrolase [Listeria monocytogenes]|uniref:family 4 glycosyl hydrolase n=1 Tax=Listeria monocytogenes TaxID=1639 RepID=UPI0035C7C561